ncbi:aldehyde dehydrogenase family protein [Mycobacterium sp.]|uniref:aldehyde dehydrogenase family protein n=1 Tax=Mycobacterium sp. TaxID=1785 RepID=UPI002CF39975|nr:aldehyde dehydrogenase family protein [Mycobacterium sp.]HTQ20667.1 aldehyde dehydrogenase family protein [Mycobacterium sp.]
MTHTLEATPGQFIVTCPATGDTVGSTLVHSSDDVAATGSRLRAAQPHWAAMGPRRRAEWLGKWRDWIFDHTEELLTLLQLESGKSWGDANIEILAGTQSINYWSDNAAKFLADESVKPSGAANLAKKLVISYHPRELVGVITPWNYPLAMPLLDIPAALMAGCAVLSKPSEFTPLAWQRAVQGWKDIGAPDVLEVVTGAGETGAAVVDAVDMVMFTGSVATGRRIGVRAAERLIPCSLELGGKDAMIVCADADIDRAVDGAIWGGFFNAGQTCISVERVYVESPVYDAFVDKLVERAQALRQGMDAEHDYSVDIGAMATEQQLKTVAAHVHDAISKGATVLTGGAAADQGLFYRPTVLVDVDHSMACMREETFGPTLPVMKVSSAQQAVELANDSAYGLSASVWTADKTKGMRLARQLNAGSVNVNNVIMNVFQFPVPMSGWAESGIGARSGGASGIRKYCKTKSIVAERLTLKKELFWYPYSPRKGRAQALAARLLGARNWRRRLNR